jgi:hypothetical protein
MRKVRVKKLRKEFEETIQYWLGTERLRSSDVYKKAWRLYKKVAKE